MKLTIQTEIEVGDDGKHCGDCNFLMDVCYPFRCLPFNCELVDDGEIGGWTKSLRCPACIAQARKVEG